MCNRYWSPGLDGSLNQSKQLNLLDEGCCKEMLQSLPETWMTAEWVTPDLRQLRSDSQLVFFVFTITFVLAGLSKTHFYSCHVLTAKTLEKKIATSDGTAAVTCKTDGCFTLKGFQVRLWPASRKPSRAARKTPSEDDVPSERAVA